MEEKGSSTWREDKGSFLAWKSINRGQETGNSWPRLHAFGDGSTSLLRATVATGGVNIFPIFSHSHVQAKSIELLFLATHPTHSAPV